MPLIIRECSLTGKTPDYFARVLSDQPQAAKQLMNADEDSPLIEAVFNGQPVGLLLASKQSTGCRGDILVVHPATRGRGVGRELLQKGTTLLPAPVEWSDSLRKLAEKWLDDKPGNL